MRLRRYPIIYDSKKFRIDRVNLLLGKSLFFKGTLGRYYANDHLSLDLTPFDMNITRRAGSMILDGNHISLFSRFISTLIDHFLYPRASALAASPAGVERAMASLDIVFPI